MREYIHLFENSDLRDAYEYGSDYTEPYVSYTPVINKYKALVDGNNIPGFNITKQKNSYLILSNDKNLIIMNPEPPIVNSNVFYTLIPFKVSTKAVDIPATRMFIIEEDLLLTKESTEFTLDGVTYYLTLEDINRWTIYTDSEHTQSNGILLKYDIVSIPLSGGPDSVHYNKKYNVIYINTYKNTTACGAVTGKGYNIRYLTLVGGIPYEEIFEYLLDNDTLVIIKFYDLDSNKKYYAIYKRPIDTFTNTYPSSTNSTQSYRTVIPQEDYVNFDPEWKFSLIYPSSCMFGGDEEESPGVIIPGEPVEDPGMIFS